MAVIIATLIAGAWVVQATGELARDEAELKRLRSDIVSLEKQREEGFKSLKATLNRRQSMAAGLNGNLAIYERRLAAQEQQYRELWEAHPVLRRVPISDTYRELLRRYAEKEITSLFVMTIRQTQQFVTGDGPPAKASRLSLSELARREDVAYARLKENRRQREILANDTSWGGKISEIVDDTGERLDREFAQLKREALDASLERARAMWMVPLGGVIEAESQARRDFDAANQAIEGANARMAELEDAISESTVRWLRDTVFSSVKRVMLTALVILAGVVLTPVAIRALLFYVMAPLASRRPAFRLFPGDSGAIGGVTSDEAMGGGAASVSAVSIQAVLKPGERLVIRPEYVQSVSVDAKRETCWLLDRQHALTSLAAGLFELERIEGDGTVVVASSTKDPLMELSRIEIPEGAAMVFQPRSLVAIAYRGSKAPRITSIWRLMSLHAWLTLQFRYLVFHGPVSILVKGCRGVRVEGAGSGRVIDQSATMGFSAGLEYSNARNGPFLPYLKGQRALFHDRFGGDRGAFVYEEVPRREQAAGISGKGIEGFTDAALKVFGI